MTKTTLRLFVKKIFGRHRHHRKKIGDASDRTLLSAADIKKVFG